MAKAVKVCTLGKHPPYGCACGGYRDKQCCETRAFPDPNEYGPCRVHGCGVRKGCKCPLPETTQSNGGSKG